MPGVHGVVPTRPTPYGIQFREKQKVKRTYGMLERQFRRFFELASHEKGNTGVRLLQLLELRLDNVVFRLGFTTSRYHARQLISHGHVTVNGRKMSIPSYITKVGDIVEIKESSLKKTLFQDILTKTKSYKVPKWLEKGKGFKGRVAQVPTRDMIDEGIQEQLIVEFYSR